MADREKIKEKISKLLAKAKDYSITEAEALVFAEKARTLMLEYEIADGELGVDRKGEYVLRHPKWQRGGFAEWRGVVMQAACRMYFCEFALDEDPDYFYVYGRQHGTDMALNFAAYLMTAIRRHLEAQGKMKDDPEFANGFCTQAAVVLKSRIEAAMAPAQGSSGGLPALLQSEVEKALMEALGSSTMINVKTKVSPLARSAGGEAGANISIERQIGSEVAELLLGVGD